MEKKELLELLEHIRGCFDIIATDLEDTHTCGTDTSDECFTCNLIRVSDVEYIQERVAEALADEEIEYDAGGTTRSPAKNQDNS